ncbi:MAG: hypothetical protein ACKO3W_14045 [bacterium]
MSSHRHTRNAQQMRSLIQNMGRSIDEARLRRLGPALSTPDVQGARVSVSKQGLDTRIGASAPDTPATQSTSGSAAGASAATAAAANGAPPIRAANEMFTDGTPRLKARPKRAS